ncbi:5-hydroxytryptamine receptor 3A-like [Engystomops pustulosus]|uniref:5-hydroxytryptamine receptor 3A-like n=1 Tax=Engystomops pustulosus TaxID=76066 RepID=UPI003AFB033F
MSRHDLALLLTCTLFGANYCQDDCSINNLIQNLTFPSQYIRPVKNWTTTTTVDIGMTLYTIVKLDTSMQSLTTLVWFSMTWENEFVQWNPNQFCFINKIFMSSDTFWKPDLYIYERIEGEDKSPYVPYYSINYNGLMKDSVPLRIVSSCKLNIFKFPFDTQKCNLTFGSYIHPVQDIVMLANMNSSQVFQSTIDVFVSKGEWNLLDITVGNKTVISEGVSYSTIYYEITIKRVPVVYIITLIVPACFMVLLDIVSMFIQMESGERLDFKITIVLGFSVLLLILNTMLPNSEVPPILGIFCCVCMAIMVVSILGCVAVSYMLMLSESQPTVPSWIKSWILKFLYRVLCFKGKYFMKFGINLSLAETYVNKRAMQKRSLQTEKNLHRSKNDSMEAKLLKMLLQEVLKIHKKIVESKEMDDSKTEWHAAALVVDRLVLVMYLLIVVIIFVTVLIVWST